jgi:hypothetical protein
MAPAPEIGTHHMAVLGLRRGMKMHRYAVLLASVLVLGIGPAVAQNADTVDGFDAYATPHANALLALDSSKHFPISVIPDNSIPGRKLAYGAVTNGRLRDGAVTTSKLAVGAVTAGRLGNNSVTTEKITDGQVMGSDLAAGAVTSSKIANNSVSTGKIKDGTIQGNDLALPLTATGSFNQMATIRGDNSATGWVSCGVAGLATSSSSSAAGVYGSSNGGGSGVLGVTMSGYGVQGWAASSGYGVYSNGDCKVEGDLTVTGSKSGYVTDIVLNGGDEPLEPGDLVEIVSYTEPVLGEIPVPVVRKTTEAMSTAVLGPIDCAVNVVPVERACPVGSGDTDGPTYHVRRSPGAIAPGGYGRVVTLGSFARIKVDASYGPISPGDLFVSSPTPGYAMASDDPGVGTVVGKALGTLEEGIGEIPVFVSPR